MNAPSLYEYRQDLPLDSLQANPHNPRIFRPRDPKFDELVESIRQHGVIEPVLARPLLEGFYELVAGERRMRASTAAGRTSIPALIRDMSDEEAFGLLMVENLQRDDLHPLEEARAIAQMRDQGWTTDQIEARLAKSARYVARRAKLNDLSLAWRECVLDADHPLGRWQAPHLELVARFDEHIQATILESLQGWQLERAAAWTPRELQEFLGRFLLAISGAPFKTTDAGLVPEAGACDTCPKRSDRQPELWDETDCGRGKSGVVARCLDKACWNRKVTIHLQRKEAELKAKHGTVVILTDYSKGEGTPWAGQGVSLYELRQCKKGDAGAVPALQVTGTDAGKTYWVKPRDENKTVNAKGEVAAVGKSLAQKRADLARLRRRLVNHAVMERLEAWVKDDAPLPELDTMTALAFVAVAGTRERYMGGRAYVDGDWVTDEPWHRFYELVAGVVTPCLGRAEASVIDSLLRSAMRTMVDRFRQSGPLDHIPDEETCWVADVFGIDMDELEAQAAAAKPEPKAWAKLEARGDDPVEP